MTSTLTPSIYDFFSLSSKMVSRHLTEDEAAQIPVPSSDDRNKVPHPGILRTGEIYMVGCRLGETSGRPAFIQLILALNKRRKRKVENNPDPKLIFPKDSIAFSDLIGCELGPCWYDRYHLVDVLGTKHGGVYASTNETRFYWQWDPRGQLQVVGYLSDVFAQEVPLVINGLWKPGNGSH